MRANEFKVKIRKSGKFALTAVVHSLCQRSPTKQTNRTIQDKQPSIMVELSNHVTPHVENRIEASSGLLS